MKKMKEKLHFLYYDKHYSAEQIKGLLGVTTEDIENMCKNTVVITRKTMFSESEIAIPKNHFKMYCGGKLCDV